MHKNFIVIYTGREGSSPIISGLNECLEVSVPLFEHLDRGNFEKYARVERVPDVMSYVFSTGEYSDDKISFMLSSGVSQIENPGKSVGFKWRPFMVPGVLETLIQHNVVIFMLLRRSVLQRALSMYFTHEYLKEGHVQFKLLGMRKDEQESKIEELRKCMFAVDPEPLESFISLTIKSKVAQWVNFCQPYMELGGTVVPIFYEDFVNQSLNFLNGILRNVGCVEFKSLPALRFQKVNRRNIEEQVTNLDEVLSLLPIKSELSRYDRLLAKILGRCQSA